MGKGSSISFYSISSWR